jgi:hypothetical protein
MCSQRLLFLVLFAAVLTLTAQGFGQAPPSADSYVTDVYPAANDGSSQILPVQHGTTSYIQFDLSGFPPSTAVSKATLRLYVNAVVAPGTFDAYVVLKAWTERGITFTNAPTLGGSATGGRGSAVAASSVNQFVMLDITSLAQGWLDGSIPNHGIALVLAGTIGSFSFDSKESTGTGHEPELQVITAGTSSSFTGVSTIPPTAKLSTSSDRLQAPGPGPDVYIDNGTALQTGANFNIDGNGTAGVLNATNAIQLQANPFISLSGWLSQSTGYNAGAVNTGDANTFVGVFAGQQNTSGAYNTVIGAQANAANQTGSYNTVVGGWAGIHNVGINNSFYGAYSGYSNTIGLNNMFFGTNAGHLNTTGNNNFFLGAGSGYNNTTGSNNTFLGYLSGQNADATANNNLYIGSLGAAGESNTTRIGDPSSQTAAYIAGINGAATSGGAPVFVDSSGKLGTGGGMVNFSQVSGTLSSPQFTGTYTSQVTLANTTNVFDGSFTGNGAGLTNVVSGASWPIVKESANYTVQLSDFSTPSTVGNFVVATGAVSLTFTLPNPAPANGQCVAIGNVIDAGINSNANAYLTVSGNGLQIDATSSYVSTHPRRANYFYCSDGVGYYRLGYVQNGVSEIGPWLKTVDTGAVNAYQTTFRNGMDFGLSQGSMIFLQVLAANTSGTPTLNVNGLGAKKILRYGNQSLAPGDLNPNAYALLIYDGSFWELLNPQTINGTVTAVTATGPLVSTGGVAPNISCPTCNTAQTIAGSSGTIGGIALSAGTCTSGTASVAGAVVGHPVSVSASDGSLPDGLTVLSAAVTSSGTVTVQLCAIANNTPAAKSYNVMTQ